MNPLFEIKHHALALKTSVDQDEKFFASILYSVRRLSELITDDAHLSRQEIGLCTEKIEEFFVRYRPSGDHTYIPPMKTRALDATVTSLHDLGRLIGVLDETSWSEACQEFLNGSGKKRQEGSRAPCVFIGHGRSKLWAHVKVFLSEDQGLRTIEYESKARAGNSIVPILEEMLEEATFAVLLFTAEDETASDTLRARQNVIHEAGLFQGRLGFSRTVILAQEGIELFSNIAGLQYIPFSGQNIDQTFYMLQKALAREGMV